MTSKAHILFLQEKRSYLCGFWRFANAYYDEVSEELLHSAKAIIEADNEMQRIKDKIGMFHEI